MTASSRLTDRSWAKMLLVYPRADRVEQRAQRTARTAQHEQQVAGHHGRQDERQDRLWVFFDEKGTLTHYGSTLEAKNSKQAWPFNRIYKKERYEGSQPEEPAEEKSAEKPDKKEEPAK